MKRVCSIMLCQPRRSVDRKRLLAFAQRKGLEHSGQAKPMVGMEVGDEHAAHIRKPNRAHQLALRAFAAVEQQPVAAATQRIAGSPRRGLGTEPPVPAKKRERSMRATVAIGARYGDKLCRRRRRLTVPPAPVAQWIERPPPERKVASSNHAGRVLESC